MQKNLANGKQQKWMLPHPGPLLVGETIAASLFPVGTLLAELLVIEY